MSAAGREGKMGHYLLAFAGSAVGAVALTPVSMKLARMLGVVDAPGVRKVHYRPTPRAGGLAIYAAAAVVVVPMLLVLSRSDPSIGRLWIVLAAASAVFLVGLIDDFINLSRAQYKLLALVAAAFVVCSSGFKLNSISFGHDRVQSLGSLAWPVSFLWIIGVTTAVNFIDGLDGLAAGICAVAAGTIALVAGLCGDAPTAIIALALAGSLCGFLVFNTNPAKVFMGDCGSMFLGFLLATLSLVCARRTGMTAGFTLPALALGIPILDTAVTMVRRGVLQRRSLFAAERGHVHHRLIDLGVRHRHAVMILYAVTLAGAVFGIAAMYSHSPVRAAILASVHPVVLIGLFAFVGSLRFGDIASAFRRNREMSRVTKQYRHTFDEMQLRFLAARSFDGWWNEVCEALHRLDFIKFSMPLTNRDGSSRVLTWDSEKPPGTAPSLHVGVPIRQRRAGGPLRAEVEVHAADSLELAGRRVTVFARLMEENSLDSVPHHRAPAEAPARPGAKTQAVVEPPPRIEVPSQPTARVAIVHDFLYIYAGAERVLEQMLEIFPDADLFSLFDFLPPGNRHFLRGKTPKTTFIQWMPFARGKHRNYLPLMPLAIEQLDVSAYDVVLSSSYCAAKGVLTRPDQLHVCYCHTPVRFAWDLQHRYLIEAGLGRGVKSVLARAVLHYIRNWDSRSANGVDTFITNSDFVSRRIEKFYRRRSGTIYPPVDVESFMLQTRKEDYYFTAGRMVPYKRIDLIVEAFAAMPDKRLIVAGEGPELDKVRDKAGPNVKLVGHQPFDRLVEYMRHAKAFVFAAEEDFGIAPVEAMACGTPVIAFGRGGVTESVVAGKTGLFFDEQTTAGLCDAVRRFEATESTFDAEAISRHAQQFNAGRFRAELLKAIEDEWISFGDPSTRKPLNARRPHPVETHLHARTTDGPGHPHPSTPSRV